MSSDGTSAITRGVHVSRRAKDLRPAVNTATETLSKEPLRSPRISRRRWMKIPEEAVTRR